MCGERKVKLYKLMANLRGDWGAERKKEDCRAFIVF